VIGTMSTDVAAGAAAPAQAKGLCSADWGIPKACQLF
jgi:hypothetical protein